MKQITEGVIFVHGRDEFIPDSHVYVIGEPSSGDLSIVDAGLMGKGNYKIESIKKDGLTLSDIKRVIMTHTHLDHIGCLREILDEIPHAELWVHRKEGEPLQQGDDRTVYGMDMFKSMCQAQYSIKPDAFTFDVDRMLEGGETLEMGGMVWEVIHIPGHSPGSVALYHRSAKILIPGDVVYADYAIGRYDLHGANGSQLRDSLMTLAELEVDILLPGHNRVVENLQPGYILKTAKQWEPYLT
jgi:hydroxyacylglutathione hydrolase